MYPNTKESVMITFVNASGGSKISRWGVTTSDTDNFRWKCMWKLKNWVPFGGARWWHCLDPPKKFDYWKEFTTHFRLDIKWHANVKVVVFETSGKC